MDKGFEEKLAESDYQPEVLEAIMKWISETPEVDLIEHLATPDSDNDDRPQAEQFRELDEQLELAEMSSPQQMIAEQDDKVIVLSNYELQRSSALVDTMRSSPKVESFSSLSVTAPAVFEQETAHVDVGDNEGFLSGDPMMSSFYSYGNYAAAECAVINAANNPMILDNTSQMYNYDVATGITSAVNPPTQPCDQVMVVDRCSAAAPNICPMEVVVNEPQEASSSAGVIPVASTSWIRTSNAGRKKDPIKQEPTPGQSLTSLEKKAENARRYRAKVRVWEDNLPLELEALKAQLKTLQKEEKKLKAKIASKELNRS